MRILVLVGMLLTSAVPALPQTPSTQPPQKLFEAGQYQQAAQALTARQQSGPLSPQETYLLGQVYARMNQPDKARQEFARLAASPDPAWKAIGQSAVALSEDKMDEALNKVGDATRQLDSTAPAAQGAAANPRTSEKFHAFYQTGLVKAKREDWAGAADAFERAAQLDPQFAYAHYYAGLAYSKIRRPDKVAPFFDHFLTLAPNAPERSAVMSIMRTIRGN